MQSSAARVAAMTGNPSAASRNSNGNDAYLSAAWGRAVCALRTEGPFSSFRGKAPLEFPNSLSAGTGLSAGGSKYAADTLASRLFLRRSQVLRLIPSALHGWVLDSELASYSARGRTPAARRLSSLFALSRTLRISSRPARLILTLPMLVILRRCR